jgi:integrase
MQHLPPGAKPTSVGFINLPNPDKRKVALKMESREKPDVAETADQQGPMSLAEVTERIAHFLDQTEPKRAISKGTSTKYRANYKSREQLGVLDKPSVGERRQKISRNSFRFNCAALRFGLRERLQGFMEQVRDDLFGVGEEQLEIDGRHWLQAIATVVDVAPPGERIDEVHSKSRFKFNDSPPSEAQVSFLKKSSKRDGLAALGPHWREEFWQKVDQGLKYATQMATLDLTGARPHDQALGGKVMRVSQSIIEVTVCGSKNSQTTGIPLRTFQFDISRELRLRDEHRSLQAASRQGTSKWVRPPVLLLADLVPTVGNVHSWNCNRKGLASAVSAVGKRAFPRHGYNVSPTSFRHEMATDLKTSGMDRIEASAAMSHRSTSTLGHYGRTVAKGRVRRVLPRIVSDISMVRNTTTPAPKWPNVRAKSAAKPAGPVKTRTPKPGAR